MPSQRDKLLKAALTYANRGWAVFPLHTPREDGTCDCRHADCKRVGKHPRTMNGMDDASTDEQQIRKWWKSWPEANIGIACAPSGLGVIDVDPEKGGEESLLSCFPDDPPYGPVVATGGGGRHYYYSAEAQPVASSIGLLPGLDIRGNKAGSGGYVVAPPSFHESGEYYSWLELYTAEDGLEDYPHEAMPKVEKKNRSVDPSAEIPDGQRNARLTSFAGTMRRTGAGYDTLLAALEAENATRCKPPLEQEEIERIAKSVSRYEPTSSVLVANGAAYSRLTKVATKPPSYILRIGDDPVKVSAKELMSHASLRVAAMEQADVFLERMKSDEWDEILSGVIESMDIEAAPEDASLEGLVWSDLRRHLAREDTGDATEFIEGVRCYIKDDALWVRGSQVRRLVDSFGYRMEQREVWNVLRARGATSQNLRLGEQTVWAWKIPLLALRDED